MKRGARRIGLLLAGFLTLFSIYLAAENIRGRTTLRRELRRLVSAGEELAISALRPKAVGENHNAAVEFAVLTNAFLFTATNGGPPSLRFTQPGVAVVPWRLNEWRVDGRTNDWGIVGGQLTTEAANLVTLHNAARKPVFVSALNYENGFIEFQVPLLAPIKQGAVTLNLLVQENLHRGRLDAAHENLIDLLGLVSQNSEPLVISQLVRQACAAIAFNGVWAALQAHGWKDEQLAEWQACLGRNDFSGDMARAFQVERAMTVAHFDLLKDRKHRGRAVREAEQASEWLVDTFATKGIVLHYINLPLWRIAWVDQDALQALRRWEQAIKMERMARKDSWKRLKQESAKDPMLSLQQEPEESGVWNKFRFPFSSVSFGISDTLIRRTLFTATHGRMAETAIALRRFQLRTGRLPEDLKELVPGYLNQLPRDDMDGATLRYRAVTSTNFVLYSVGPNGEDDGGDPSPPERQRPLPQMWAGKDAVWPTPATDAEATEAMVPAAAAAARGRR